MRYRNLFLISVLSLGILAIARPAPAYYNIHSFGLERTVIRGYVQSVEDQVACIETADGDEVTVQLGPETYWSQHRYWLPVGDFVVMQVWYDPRYEYTEWYFAAEIWGPDYHFALTNDEGLPYWVLYADDYYYGLGYRTSCVSFMFWYDCPPVYFVCLLLPPPPPMGYFCYYGPHWRTHHHDWHHGPRYGHNGSYWRDRHGYEPPEHRPGRRGGGENSPNGGNLSSMTYPTVNPGPADPVIPAPKIKQPNVNRGDESKTKSYPDYNQKIIKTKDRSDSRKDAPAVKNEQKDAVKKPERKQSSDQPKIKAQPKLNDNSSKIVPQPKRDREKAKDNRSSQNTKSEKRSFADNLGKIRK